MPAAPTLSPTPSLKRDHLLATAERLFYRDGFRIVGIDTLLAEAGVAKMTLYNHFSSKEALIVAVLEQRDQAILVALRNAVEAAGRSPVRRLQAVFDWHEHWFGQKDYKGCAFIRALSEYPEPDHPIHQTAWKHKLAVRALLAECCAETGVSKAESLADTFSLLLDGAIIAAHATGTTEPAALAWATATALLKQATA